MRHVIGTNNHFWPAQRFSDQKYRSILPAADLWSDRYIRHISYMFCDA